MILLGFESVEENGVVAYPDHANPHQYWYIPANIHLAQRDGNVIFTLIKYRPDPQKPGTSGGGFLTCEVNLSLDEDLKNRLKNKILHTFRNKGVTRDNLTLSPVLYDLGKVGVSALNVSQNNIWTASSPSLSGNNTAILSLTLDQNQATSLDAAYKDEGKPVGVSYQLEFTAMRPALDVEVTADYKAIKNAFQTKFSASIPLDQAGITRFGVDFESQFQKLREQNHLKIKVLDYYTDTYNNEREKWALDFVKEQLLRDFFVRKLNDMPDFPAAGSSKSEELMNKLANNMAAQNQANAAVPGAPSAPLLSPLELGSLQFRYNHQDEARTFKFLYNESKVVKQFNFPQSFFGTLLKNVYKDEPYFIEIDLNDPFFQTIDISVQAPLNSYGDIGLTSAQVVLKYDGDQRDFNFDSQKPGEQKGRFNVNQAVGTAYQYQVQYNFQSKNASGWSGSASYKDPEWHTTEVRTLTLMPHQQITFLNVAVSLEDGFEWNGINATKVHLTPVDSQETETLTFTKNNSATQRWKIRVLKPNENYYNYRVEYVMDNKSILPAKTKSETNASILLVPEPPNILKVTLRPSGIDWNVVAAVEVKLRYEDLVNGINQSSKAFLFDSEANQPKSWSVQLTNPDATQYKWQAMYYMNDGSEKAHPAGGTWEERSGSQVFLNSFVPKS
jgi:hypothetical protein